MSKFGALASPLRSQVLIWNASVEGEGGSVKNRSVSTRAAELELELELELMELILLPELELELELKFQAGTVISSGLPLK